MSRFRFRLERVLGVRRVEEEVARAEWLSAERAARDAEESAARADEAVSAARGRVAALQASAQLSASEVLIAQASLDRLREVCVQRTIQASRLRRDAERLRESMAERRSRVRGLETLEERARDRWRAESETRANAELDEYGGRTDREDFSRPAASPDDELPTTRQTWS